MQELAPEVAHELLVTHTQRPADPDAAVACTTLDRVSYLSDTEPGVLRRHLLMVWWLLRNLRRFDVVHFRTHADWYFLTYLLARLARRRLVLSATLDDSLLVLIGRYRPRLRAVAARGFALFDAYVSISPKLQAESLRAGASPDRCHLVPCGVTAPPLSASRRQELRVSLGIGEDDPVLLFVGGLCERKDPLFLVQALPEIRRHHPRARLLLLGPTLEPDHVEKIGQTIVAEGLGDAVHVLGEQRDPHPWYGAADILVFASHLEGFGTVVPEGMAHGLPVVVRRLPGVNDTFVMDGETGFLFDDMAGFIAGVNALAGDPGLRRKLGGAGRSLALRQFGMRRIATRYLDIYGFAPSTPAIWTGHGRPRPAGPGQEESRQDESRHEESPQETGLGHGASVTDRRFHTPVSPAGGPPLLITMVDAEEDFDWSRPFSRDAFDVGSMRSQHLAHRVFERHGVVPLYLVDYPVAAQDAGRSPLREFLADRACEIGSQMHPWVTPPFVEPVNEYNSYAGNLPTTLELEKARVLTETLEETFGTRPRIYRTGRFGGGPRTADILKRLGYEADSSVVPYWPREGCSRRADAWAPSAAPYWIDRERTLMEIPVSASLVGRLVNRHSQRMAPWLFHPVSARVGLPGLAARLGLMERIRLSPEGITVGEAKRLTRAMLAGGQRVFVLTYHSPSLEPGNTPYVRTVAQRERFLAWLDEFYTFFREEVGGRSASWREVRGVAETRID